MKNVLLIILRIVVILGLFATGFATGFPVGQHRGFESGYEWAIVQADIAAREAGMELPFTLEDGEIRVVVRQNPDLHKWAQKQAALYNDRIPVINVAKSAMPVDFEPAD